MYEFDPAERGTNPWLSLLKAALIVGIPIGLAYLVVVVLP